MSNESSSTVGRAELKGRVGQVAEVQALDYIKLRELAEASAGVQNQSVDFFFPEGKVLRRAMPGQALRDSDVLVPVYNRGKYPRNHLWLSTSADPVSVEGKTAITDADAVFWSDAAVHKFLIPYAASVGGESAGKWVTDIQGAWNCYPSADVTVYALVHLTPTRTDEDLDPTRSLLVAFVATGETDVRCLTVPEFVAEFKPVETPMPLPIPVKYERGAGTVPPQRPDYPQVRAMAEWAASLRDEPGYFVFRSGEQGFETPVSSTPPQVGPGDIVVPTFSPTVPDKRPVLEGVFFEPEGGTTKTNLAFDGDALFWSTGSIEQFIVPYYASRGGLQSLPDLADIATTWETTGPGRATQPHADQPVVVDGGAPTPAAIDAGVQVYGLIHLPTSQWTEVGAGFTVTRMNAASHFKMLGVTRQGDTRMHRPHAFMARR